MRFRRPAGSHVCCASSGLVLGMAPVVCRRACGPTSTSSSLPLMPEPGISEAGFRFLLAGLYFQLWAVVRQYLAGLGAEPAEAHASSSPGSGPGLAVAIDFLLRLGLQAGRPICYSQLDPAERAIASHMAQLGLLMPASTASDVWLHPTRLAAVLAGGGRAGESATASEDGYVIVESNFRQGGAGSSPAQQVHSASEGNHVVLLDACSPSASSSLEALVTASSTACLVFSLMPAHSPPLGRVYAYTTSAVQVAVLRIFVRCDALLPNLFVGTITRDSATAALALGITANQMADFLRQHAHPRVAAKHPVVPAVRQPWAREVEGDAAVRLSATSPRLTAILFTAFSLACLRLPASANALLGRTANSCLAHFECRCPHYWAVLAPTVAALWCVSHRLSQTSSDCGRQSAAGCMRSRLPSTRVLRARSSFQERWSLPDRRGHCCSAHRSGSSWLCSLPSTMTCGGTCATASWRWASEGHWSGPTCKAGLAPAEQPTWPSLLRSHSAA